LLLINHNFKTFVQIIYYSCTVFFAGRKRGSPTEEEVREALIVPTELLEALIVPTELLVEVNFNDEAFLVFNFDADLAIDGCVGVAVCAVV